MYHITLKLVACCMALLLVMASCTTEQTVGPELAENASADQKESPNATALSKGSITPCEMPGDYLGSGELGFWVCEGSSLVEDEITVRDLLSESNVANHESTTNCTDRFNWNAGVTTSGGSCPGADAGNIMDWDRTYLVYTTGAGNGTCGSGGNCDRIIVRYEEPQTAVDPDIWGVHDFGLFTDVDNTGPTWFIDSNVPKLDDFYTLTGTYREGGGNGDGYLEGNPPAVLDHFLTFNSILENEPSDGQEIRVAGSRHSSQIINWTHVYDWEEL